MSRKLLLIFLTLSTIFLSLWLPVKVGGEEFSLHEFELSLITNKNPSSDYNSNPIYFFDSFFIGVIIAMCGQSGLFISLFVFNPKIKSWILKISVVILWVSLLLVILTSEYFLFGLPFIISSIMLFIKAGKNTKKKQQ